MNDEFSNCHSWAFISPDIKLIEEFSTAVGFFCSLKYGGILYTDLFYKLFVPYYRYDKAE
jgi:hypothetical protein